MVLMQYIFNTEIMPLLQWRVLGFLSMHGRVRQKNFDWCIEQTILKNGVPWDANMILDDGGDLTMMIHKDIQKCLKGYMVSQRKLQQGFID